jgi:nucleotide-binding universal stress UspA family protein
MMEPRVLIYTSFTETSRNALHYACQFALERNFPLVLVHNYDPPLNYAADPLAFSSINVSLEDTEEKLKEERNWAVSQYAGLTIEYRLTFGTPSVAIQGLSDEFKIDFLITGAPESGGEFWGWNNEFVDILNSLPVPVLIIPKTVSYQRLTNIGFASDYAAMLTPQQLSFIKRMLDPGQNQLHIIHVSVPGKKNEAQRIKHREALEASLAQYSPVYASIENTDVVATIINYIRSFSLQLLIVIPRKHGIWYSVFNQRHSKRLTRINHLPILTLND